MCTYVCVRIHTHAHRRAHTRTHTYNTVPRRAKDRQRGRRGKEDAGDQPRRRVRLQLLKPQIRSPGPMITSDRYGLPTAFTVPREDRVCVCARTCVMKEEENVGLLTQLKFNTCLFSRHLLQGDSEEKRRRVIGSCRVLWGRLRRRVSVSLHPRMLARFTRAWRAHGRTRAQVSQSSRPAAASPLSFPTNER